MGKVRDGPTCRWLNLVSTEGRVVDEWLGREAEGTRRDAEGTGTVRSHSNGFV